MLRMTIALATTFILTTGAAIGEERQELPSLPSVGQVDMQGVQEQIDALLKKVKDQQIGTLPAKPTTGQNAQNNEEQTSKASAEEEAQCAMQQFHSKDRQQEIKQETSRVQREIFAQQGINPQPEQSEEQLGQNETVYVFLSSSMPEAMVWAYLNRIAVIKGGKVVPVMYGLVQGFEGKAATAEYISQIMKVDSNCQDAPEVPCDRFSVEIRINPMLFKKYDISVVPSVVYDNGKNWWSIQGDATLDYLLEQINRDAHSQTMDSLIATMRRKTNEQPRN